MTAGAPRDGGVSAPYKPECACHPRTDSARCLSLRSGSVRVGSLRTRREYALAPSQPRWRNFTPNPPPSTGTRPFFILLALPVCRIPLIASYRFTTFYSIFHALLYSSVLIVQPDNKLALLSTIIGRLRFTSFPDYLPHALISTPFKLYIFPPVLRLGGCLLTYFFVLCFSLDCVLYTF